MAVDLQTSASELGRKDLYERLGWLIRLRWLAAMGLFATVLVARYGLDLRPAVFPLLVLNGVLFVSNACYLLLWHTWREATVNRLVRFAVVQTVMDYFILTIVLHYSGGVENPLLATFVFQCIIASMLFRAGLSYLLAAMAMLMVGAMVVLEQTGIWPHWHMSGYLPLEGPERNLFITGVLISLAIVLFVAVYLSTTIERASRRRRREVAKRALELNDAREQIRQADKMAALGELAASMAHDINNPAGVICTRFEIMEAEGAFDNLPERLRKDLSTLRECADYLRRVAENWTGFTRKSKPRLGRVDLNEAVRRASDMVAESLSTHGIWVRIALHDSPLWVYGDLVRLQQVVLNLVNNARDATARGGMLTIQTSINSESEGEPQAILKVEDTGEGIEPDDLSRIFEPLFSRKPHGQGTGLGLAICQKVVKSMDGEIRVRSRLGEGTVFTILLPVYAPSERTESYVSL